MSKFLSQIRQNLGEGKKREQILPSEAHEVLKQHNALGKDFHSLRSSDVEGLLSHAKKTGYKAGKNAPGSTGRMYHAHLSKIAAKHTVKEDFDAELDAIYDGTVTLNEEYDEHAHHELVIHGDNDSHLYHSSHVPVAKNLEKKHKKGIYDPEKAKKLWKYHADRAAQSYHAQHGDKSQHWKHTFSPETRRAAASHWEKHHRTEMEAGNFHS